MENSEQTAYETPTAEETAMDMPEATDAAEPAEAETEKDESPETFPELPEPGESDGAPEPAEAETPPEAEEAETGEDTEPDSFEVSRKPYSSRYYLLFGGESVPESLDLQGTREMLTALGFSSSSLRQAREGKHVADRIANTTAAKHTSAQHCDFCGTELLGTEYESLADGRVRCKHCARTAVKDQEEFENIYRSVKRNMELFFGVRIREPINIKMVSARKLHSEIGKVFTPTTEQTARTIGLAIRERDGNYDILMENGAPRMQSITTMVHEMTHIWQYINWNAERIRSLYGSASELQIYEGMARWAEVQYTYLINEAAEARRMEIMVGMEKNVYGTGFKKYASVYPLVDNAVALTETPFLNPERPL